MTCLKCNKEVNLEWLCCPFHAELVMLKEKCPECGEMERIGRVVCEGKVREAKKKCSEFVSIGIGKVWIFFFCVAISEIFMAFWAIDIYNPIKPISEINVSFSILLVPFLNVPLFLTLLSKIEKRKEQEFLRLHPEYAEILKKAKGEKN